MAMKNTTLFILLGLVLAGLAEASESRSPGFSGPITLKKTSAIPEFRQTGKTPVARVRLHNFNSLTNPNGFFDWKVDGAVVNPLVRGVLSMQCPAPSHLTYLAYQLKLPNTSSPEVVYEESRHKAGISGKSTQIALRPFKNDHLVNACIKRLDTMHPTQWATPFVQTLKARVTAIGRCSGGPHPNHTPSRLIRRDYPVTLTLQCATNFQKTGQ